MPASPVEAAPHHKEHFLSKSVSRQSSNHVPEPVAPIAEVMSAFRAPWALCGGWAVDAWLGRLTREHADVDIAVFVQDQRALFDHLAGWQLVAHDPHVSGDTAEPWDGRPLGLPGHLHGRLDAGEALPDGVLTLQQGFSLDIQLNERSGDDWILSRQPRISLPLRNGVQRSPWGLPTVVSEVLLFYKASELRRRDKLDFLALLPDLTQEQRDWLRSAISLVGHPWLSQLSP
jgi:hypothetical protein